MKHPGKPLFLVGHSMGGAIVLTAALGGELDVKGVVAMGPMIEVRTDKMH